MSKTIGIIGGDLRIIRLAEILAKEEYFVYTYGLEKYNFSSKNIVQCTSMEEVICKCNYIISGIPFSKDGSNLILEYSNNQITIEEMFSKISSKKLIAGGINEKTIQKANDKNIEIIDLLKIEELTVLNVIPTVEGAIQVAMEQTEFTLNGSKCLILGFGRIGKLLAKSLVALGVNTYCIARKEKDIAWIMAYGYNPIHINDLEETLKNRYDIIFNTIPSLILDNKKLEILINYNPLIIELASKPWGVDFKKAEELGINVIKASGLPGKVAPLTSAINIKNILEKIIK